MSVCVGTLCLCLSVVTLCFFLSVCGNPFILSVCLWERIHVVCLWEHIHFVCLWEIFHFVCLWESFHFVCLSVGKLSFRLSVCGKAFISSVCLWESFHFACPWKHNVRHEDIIIYVLCKFNIAREEWRVDALRPYTLPLTLRVRGVVAVFPAVIYAWTFRIKTVG